MLEVRGLTIVADYFVICSGASTSQVKTIAEHVEEVLEKQGVRPLRIEGVRYAHWILMDYGDVVAHVFLDETRSYYELEKLWLDAPRVVLSEADRNLVGRQDQRTLSR